VARPWLHASERENNLILSSLRSATRHHSPARGWLVMGEQAPGLALFQVPSHYLLLSQGTSAAAEWAAGYLDAELPGVFGAAAVADGFAAGWSMRSGHGAVLNSQMTFYTLESVTPYARPSGCLRRAAPEEFARLAPMAAAAARDMNLPAPEQRPSETDQGLRRAIEEGKQFVWADGSQIRAMASFVEVLPGAGARIRGVYAPPEFRGRGYGTAITGSLAEMLLDEGQAWVSLFADNANPVSTGIYLRLGFRPEGIYNSYRFEPV
jgi:RimJ/RimL family protein N-acetyltransferase